MSFLGSALVVVRSLPVVQPLRGFRTTTTASVLARACGGHRCDTLHVDNESSPLRSEAASTSCSKSTARTSASRRPHSTTTSDTSSGNNNNFLKECFSLQGRCAIITGGGSGIGAALAMGLARAGASVVLTARRKGVLEETRQRIVQQLLQDNDNGESSSYIEQQVHIYPCDITDFSSIPNLVREAEYKTGIAPTILINNAGANVRKSVMDLSSDDFDQSFALMVTAPFLLTRALAPHMQQLQHGRIINLASLQSYRAFPDSIPYATAKSGILGFTRAMSEAYSPFQGYTNVTINAIAPGYVQTDLTASVFANETRAAQLANQTILGRNSIPDDLVGATIFLCSPAASYITGQTLCVDGGFTALGLR